MDLTRGFLLRCNWKIQDSQLIANFAEVPRAGFTGDPLGCADGAQCEAAAAVGVVANLKRINLAGCGDNVLALGVAYAVRSDRDINARTNRLNDLAQSDGGAEGASSLETWWVSLMEKL